MVGGALWAARVDVPGAGDRSGVVDEQGALVVEELQSHVRLDEECECAGEGAVDVEEGAAPEQG